MPSNFPQINLKSLPGIPMITNQPPRPTPAWHMLGIVGTPPVPLYPHYPASCPIIICSLTLHCIEQCHGQSDIYHLYYTSRHPDLQSYTDLNTVIYHRQSQSQAWSDCTTYYLSPQVQSAQLVARLDWSLEGWKPSDFSINKASEFESNTPGF